MYFSSNFHNCNYNRRLDSFVCLFVFFSLFQDIVRSLAQGKKKNQKYRKSILFTHFKRSRIPKFGTNSSRRYDCDFSLLETLGWNHKNNTVARMLLMLMLLLVIYRSHFDVTFCRQRRRYSMLPLLLRAFLRLMLFQRQRISKEPAMSYGCLGKALSTIRLPGIGDLNEAIFRCKIPSLSWLPGRLGRLLLFR